MARPSKFTGWEDAEPFPLLDAEAEDPKVPTTSPQEPAEAEEETSGESKGSWADGVAFEWSERDLVATLPELPPAKLPLQMPSVLLDDTSLVRENVFTMVRLRDMKRRLNQKADREPLVKRKVERERKANKAGAGPPSEPPSAATRVNSDKPNWNDFEFPEIPEYLKGSIGAAPAATRTKEQKTAPKSKKNKLKVEAGAGGGADYDYVSASRAGLVEPLDPMVCYTLDIPERYIPTASTMTTPQAALLMQEVVSLIQIHAGYDSLSSLTTNVLTDISVEFLKRLGQQLAREYEAASMAATSLLIRKKKRVEAPTAPGGTPSSGKAQVRFVSTSERQMGLRATFTLPKAMPSVTRRNSVDSTGGEMAGIKSKSSTPVLGPTTPRASEVVEEKAPSVSHDAPLKMSLHSNERVPLKKEPLQESHSTATNGVAGSKEQQPSDTPSKEAAKPTAQAAPMNVGGKKHATKKAAAPKVPEQPREAASREAVVAYKSLLQFGCSLRSLEQFLVRTIKFGDGLRVIDRKMLKKGNKLKKSSNEGSSAKPRKHRDNEDATLTAEMIHALLNAPLGSSLLETQKRANMLTAPQEANSGAGAATESKQPDESHKSATAAVPTAPSSVTKKPSSVVSPGGKAALAVTASPLAKGAGTPGSGSKLAAAALMTENDVLPWPPKFDDSPTKMLADVTGHVVPPPDGEIDLMSLDSIFEAGFVLPLDGEMLSLDGAYDLQALDQS